MTAPRLTADRRLFLSYLLLIFVLVASLSVGAHLLLRRHLLQIVEGDLTRELRIARALHEASPELAHDSVADLVASLSDRRATIVAPDGRVLGESTLDGADLAAMENHLRRPEIQAALRGEPESSIRYSTTLEAPLLYVATRSGRGDVIRLAVPLSQIDRALDRVQRGILGVGMAAVVLAAVFSFGFSIAITKPLRRVQAAASAMAAGDLSIRLRERRRDEFGQLADALDSLADELQRRLAQLEGEQTQTQALFDAMSEGVIALTPDGAVRRANPAAQRMFALPSRVPVEAPEAVSRRPEFLRLVRRALDGSQVAPTELSSDGRSLLATAHPLPDGGAVLVFLDISPLRRLEGVRRDFVANASHELKTPLTAIRGYSETLLDPNLPPDLSRQFAGIVKDHADRLQRIVDDLLDLSRIESGGWVVHPETVSLEAVAQDAWESQAKPLEEKRIRFHLVAEPGAEQVHCDPGALRQVLSNLFSNALRYTPDGGSVTLRSRPAASSAPSAPPAPERGLPWIVLEVSDTGAGIPAAYLPRIFERFYRVDPARSRVEGGTGLGLAIVKHLVEAHGGRIEAESAVGRGTTIRFTLPARA